MANQETTQCETMQNNIKQHCAKSVVLSVSHFLGIVSQQPDMRRKAAYLLAQISCETVLFVNSFTC
jgi:hypothetical protein